MLENERNTEVNTLNVPDDLLEVFEFYAHCILGEKTYEDRLRMIIQLQVEIHTLNQQFKIPIARFMKDYERLIESELDDTIYKKTNDYQAHPERMVKDLLNFVCRFLGYSAFYKSLTGYRREDRDSNP